MRAIDEELENLGKNNKNGEKLASSREDFHRIMKVAADSPIIVVSNGDQGSLGRKTLESFKEIEKNRRLHLAKQGRLNAFARLIEFISAFYLFLAGKQREDVIYVDQFIYREPSNFGGEETSGGVKEASSR